MKKAKYHLPGLYEFYELYKVFLPLYYKHREFFYEWCEIGSIYGSPYGVLWGGGRIENSDTATEDVIALLSEFGVSARLTFSNLCIKEEHLADKKCNILCKAYNNSAIVKNGVIIGSDLLLEYIKSNYSKLYYVSSTTKVITNFDFLIEELNRDDFSYVVPDFRLNKLYDKLDSLTLDKKNKLELLCNECCYFGCFDRRRCYESVSLKILGEDDGFRCSAPDLLGGYRFSDAMKNPGFIGIDDIVNKYLPMDISNFKIEGRGLGSALILEFLLYYMTKPEYQINVREEIYLDNSLDLF